MRTLARLACCLMLCWHTNIGLTGELGGASVSPAHIRLTPLAAIVARAQVRGLRLRSVRWDAVLQQSWAVLEDIDHPEWPLWSEATDPIDPLEGVNVPGGAGRPSAAPPPPRPAVAVVRYGNRVRLWRTEQNVRIEMSAIAESSAGVGEEIKLRIPGSGIDGDRGWRLVGVVKGPGEVEMAQ